MIVVMVRFVVTYYTAPPMTVFKTEDAEIEHILTIDAPTDVANAVQGAVYDGEYYYIAFIDRTDEYHTAIIVKADSEGNQIQRSDVLPLDHANSITVLEDGNLMIAHCYSPDEHYQRYSILDKDTFEIIETGDLNEPFMAIAYSTERDCYVSGEWLGIKMNVYKSDLSLYTTFMVSFIEETVPQSYYCTADEIYSIRCAVDEGVFLNYLYVYSYEGENLLEYELEMPKSCEAEAVSVVENDVYVICGDSGRCEIYRITNLISKV